MGISGFFSYCAFWSFEPDWKILFHYLSVANSTRSNTTRIETNCLWHKFFSLRLGLSDLSTVHTADVSLRLWIYRFFWNNTISRNHDYVSHWGKIRFSLNYPNLASQIFHICWQIFSRSGNTAQLKRRRPVCTVSTTDRRWPCPNGPYSPV